MESMVDGNGGGSRLVVMTELSRIKELVKQLDVHLRGCPDLCKNLAEQICTVTERSIGMISSGNFDGRKRSAVSAGLDSPTLSGMPSPLSGVSGTPFKTSKKRKMMAKGEHQVRVSSAGGGSEALDDGCSWRKYGQKEILGAKHPRGYYRCTYRKSQGCAATKQVQRADEDPTLFDVTYHGTHTCLHKTAAAAAKAQPESSTLNPDARSLLKSMTVTTSGPQQSTPFSFSSSSVTGLTPPGHYPSSMPSTPEDFWGLELPPATSDSSSYDFMYPFHVESELEKMVSATAFVDSASTPPVEETGFFQDGFELFDFDPNFDVPIFLV